MPKKPSAKPDQAAKSAAPKKATITGTPKTLVLLDAHAILHRAYHALPDFSSSKGEPTGALYGLSSMLMRIIAELKPDYIVACYDLPQPTYRHEAFKDYKAQRKKADPELVAQMQRSRDIFTAFSIPIYDLAGFEADDMLGTITARLSDDEQTRIVIASGDMDTLQLVSGKKVTVYTLKKGINDTILYDEDAVRARFGFGPEHIPDFKGLRGDPSDNIPGIKGIGEKTASILVQKFGAIETMYAAIKKGGTAVLKEAGLTDRVAGLITAGEEEALFSKMLATIRRDAPIDFALPEKIWRETVSIDTIKKLFTELEFRTFGARINELFSGNGGAVAPKKSGATGTSTTTTTTTVARTGTATTASADAESNLAGLDDAAAETMTAGPDVSAGDTLFGAIAQPLPDAPPEEIKETALALWVADSNKTNPTLEDIVNFAAMRTESGTIKDFATAKAAVFAYLAERHGEAVYNDIEKPLLPVIARMEMRGVKISTEHLKNLSKIYKEKIKELEHEIWRYAGAGADGTGTTPKEFNISSPKQLGEVLFGTLALKAKNQKRTGTGQLSTKESELEKLVGVHPIIKPIMAYRELTKLLSTYIEVIPRLVDQEQRLHPTLILAGSTTGRMASENPGVQNIPIKTDLGRAIREAFIASSGMELVSVDYSQMELRIAAFMSGDQKLIDIFRRGEDVHTAVAAQVFNVPPAEVTKEMRRQAKVINFGVMYGMGVLALRQNLGAETTTREAAQQFYNQYFEKFEGLANYLERTKKFAAERGFTETFFGRRRYFSGIRSHLPHIRAAAERMAINAPVQGTGADIIKMAMARIDAYLQKEGLNKIDGAGVGGGAAKSAGKGEGKNSTKNRGAYMLLQVHDELLFEIESALVPKVVPEIKRIMESIIDPEKTGGVTCVAEAKIGKNWSEMKGLSL